MNRRGLLGFLAKAAVAAPVAIPAVTEALASKPPVPAAPAAVKPEEIEWVPVGDITYSTCVSQASMCTAISVTASAIPPDAVYDSASRRFYVRKMRNAP